MIREIEIPRNEFIDTLADPGKVSGFVSPAEDYAQKRLHIAQRIVKDPVNTFYFEADDDQMRFFGIYKGSIIVVDKTAVVRSGSIIVCCVDGEWLTRKLCIRGSQTLLCLNNNFEACLNITGKEIDIVGAVTWTCLPHNN
ncbi:MAG: error-prone repair protein UmuD [Flavobacterium sp.]|nr:MAG: error-prone repair protein UmuD [Flavobacterium sp.]